ncbi:MAG: hypothetical protein WA208_11850 [Thermoanaerobaculia bacterium]
MSRASESRALIVLFFAAAFSAGTVLDAQPFPFPPDPCSLPRPLAPQLPRPEVAITTLAGEHEPIGLSDGPGPLARFGSARGVAADSRGNVFVTDPPNGTIRKISPAGMVTTLAGLAGRHMSCDGSGSEARFDAPFGITTDVQGNIYVGDPSSSTIRKITPSGVATTVAGGLPGSADGFGKAAGFRAPAGLATDANGNLYVADRDNSTIRRITPEGEVSTLAGFAGIRGSSDGVGSGARFAVPEGVAVDAGGNVFVADTGNHSIRRITPAGAVTTIAGLSRTFGHVDATRSDARFNYPAGLAIDRDGNLYVADGGNRVVRKVTAAGAVTTIPETGGPTFGVAIDGQGYLYVAAGATVFRIGAEGEARTLAGPVNPLSGSADGIGTAARFSEPAGIAVASSGDVYVADLQNFTIRKITPEGHVTTLAGVAGESGSSDGIGSSARFQWPNGLATDAGDNIYVADTANQTIRKITPSGVVTTLAGRVGVSGNADGSRSEARFSWPKAVAVDRNGSVYVVDGASTIRKITAAGVVTTVAGRANTWGSDDGVGPAARFHLPRDLAVDSSGNLYVVDGMSTIRRITPAGMVTTLLRGVEASGVAVDTADRIYLTDRSSIRRMAADGTLQTIAGDEALGSVDGMGTEARFSALSAIAVDSRGQLFVADVETHSIRTGRPVLPDLATIDSSRDKTAVMRQLGTDQRTAIAWRWTMIRRPADSLAELSSASVENPTFTPDVEGLFRFQLVATRGEAASISTVDFTSTVSASERRRAIRH